ncbi:MAG: dienelactone hydrolase family protein [Armatimonadota bacterium]
MSRRGLLGGLGAAAVAAKAGATAEGPEARPVRGDAYRKKLLQCLGGEWPKGGPLEPVVEKREQKDGYRLERLTYLVEPGERIAAYLLVPDGATESRPAPGICVWHQHNGAYDIGMAEPAGLKLGPMHHTGLALAREGYVVLCPDAAGFGERNRRGGLNGRNLEHYLFAMYVADGKCLAWKNILDMRRAVDLISSRPEVDARRLGCYGHSMGSTHTWLVGPWEPRLKALVGNCCMPTYAAMERTDLIHCFPNYIPGWRRHGDIPDIAGMIAPRALHLNFGETDSGSPIEEVKTGVEVIRRAYQAKKVEDRFTYYIEPGSGHILSDEMLRRTKAHFARHLKGAASG